MASLKVHLVFPEDKITEPIIHQIGHEYKVVTNIRRADVREKTGWVNLEITGEASELERVIAGLKNKGVTVELIEGDVLEP